MARAKSPASRKTPPSKASPPSFSGREGPFDGVESHLVVMGRIVGPFGVQGWVKVKTFTAEARGLAGFPDWLVRTPEGWREMKIEDFAVHSKGPVAKLAACDDREAAERLRGCDVAVTREQLGEADEGSLYWVDLVGLDVVDEKGKPLGKVEGLIEAGDTSVLVVRGSPLGQGGKAARQRMIPFVPDYVKAVDREAKRITVDWKADYDT